MQAGYRKERAADTGTIAITRVVSACSLWAISKFPRKIIQKSKLTDSRLIHTLNTVSL